MQLPADMDAELKSVGFRNITEEEPEDNMICYVLRPDNKGKHFGYRADILRNGAWQMFGDGVSHWLYLKPNDPRPASMGDILTPVSLEILTRLGGRYYTDMVTRLGLTRRTITPNDEHEPMTTGLHLI